MLIRNAEIRGPDRTWKRADVRVSGAVIDAVGQLESFPGETIVEAGGGVLLPGLHDHHIHLAAAAARANSVTCGPPEVTCAEQLAARLAAAPGTGWIRGIGYHESVMGLPEAAELDRLVPDRPLRMQHRSGRMWLLNSAAIQELAPHGEPDGLRRGHLFEADDWLRAALGGTWPDLSALSAELAAQGITGVTELSPRNDIATALQLERDRAGGRLQQGLILGGNLALGKAPESPLWRLGPAKLHLHENALPDFAEVVRFIAAGHEQGRPLASHCTTETELVFTLAALEEAGAMAGDRIEHAGIAPDHLVAEIARLGLAVVSQPQFIAERGDQYLAAVDPLDIPALYRLQAFRKAGVALAAGSDAPFAATDPWAAMRAAMSRRTLGGAVIGPDEALSAKEALDLWLADPVDLGRVRTIAPGAPADLCLLARPWRQVRERLCSTDVRITIAGGGIIHQRIDEAPFERGGG